MVKTSYVNIQVLIGSGLPKPGEVRMGGIVLSMNDTMDKFIGLATSSNGEDVIPLKLPPGDALTLDGSTLADVINTATEAAKSEIRNGASELYDTLSEVQTAIEGNKQENVVLRQLLDNKVDKENGKTLIPVSELNRLATITNVELSNDPTSGDPMRALSLEGAKNIIDTIANIPLGRSLAKTMVNVKVPSQFPTIYEALDYIYKTYEKYDNTNVYLTLESGFVWDQKVTWDKRDLDWVRLVSEDAVVQCNSGIGEALRLIGCKGPSFEITLDCGPDSSRNVIGINLMYGSKINLGVNAGIHGMSTAIMCDKSSEIETNTNDLTNNNYGITVYGRGNIRRPNVSGNTIGIIVYGDCYIEQPNADGCSIGINTTLNGKSTIMYGTAQNCTNSGIAVSGGTCYVKMTNTYGSTYTHKCYSGAIMRVVGIVGKCNIPLNTITTSGICFGSSSSSSRSL